MATKSEVALDILRKGGHVGQGACAVLFVSPPREHAATTVEGTKRLRATCDLGESYPGNVSVLKHGLDINRIEGRLWIRIDEPKTQIMETLKVLAKRPRRRPPKKPAAVGLGSEH